MAFEGFTDPYSALLKEARRTNAQGDMDSFLSEETQPQTFNKVGSLDDVLNALGLEKSAFFKLSGDAQLDHRSSQDLWKIAQDPEGNPVITRLFNQDPFDPQTLVPVPV